MSQTTTKKSFVSRLIGWDTWVDQPIPLKELDSNLREAALPTTGYVVMLSAATFIATLGLVANNTAVIVGAMIIAPLMNPIMTMTLGMTRGDWKLVGGSAAILVVSIIWVIGLSYLTSLLIGSRIVGSEILSRGTPNFLDLGVAIGAGVAGAFAQSRTKISNALPGVAISVALVPPLCVVGIGLNLSTDMILEPGKSILDEGLIVKFGALFLFATNFAAILLFGGLVFFTQGYSKLKMASGGFVISVCFFVLIAVPLFATFRDLTFRSRCLHAFAEARYATPHLDKAKIRSAAIDLSQDPPVLYADVEAPVGLITAEKLSRVKERLRETLGSEVTLKVRLFEFKDVSEASD
jgi:uncharacterized hydrophobic protein (TIGR00271 family)